MNTAESDCVEAHLPCPDCSSSDALATYSDGHTYCHACGIRRDGDGSNVEQHQRMVLETPIPEGAPSALPARGIHEETAAKWGYLVGHHNGKPCQIAVYRDDKSGQPVAAKLRFADKTFSFVGSPKKAGLYGKWLWSGGGKMLTITEGEIDALSVSQAQGNKYPVVSLPNGAAAALKAIERDYEWVCSFDRVNLWFDNDKPGREAAKEVADALPPGLVHIVKGELKDANEYLKAGRTAEIISLIWRAEPYRPDGIVAGSEISLERLRATLAHGYELPYPILNARLHGLRKREIIMLTAGTGVGKSTLAREIAYHLHQVHGLTIGNVYLEESNVKTAQGYIAIHNNVPLGELRSKNDLLSDEEWARSYAKVVEDRMFFYDHFGSLESENLLSKLRYLAVGCHCDFIILDHISIVVSGQEGSGEGERRDIDRLLTDLRSLVEATGVGVIAIVHLKKAPGVSHEEGGRVTMDHLRGSGALKQIPDSILAIECDQQGEHPDMSTLRLLKNREFGDRGECDTMRYDSGTGRLLPCAPEEFQNETSNTDDDIPF